MNPITKTLVAILAAQAVREYTKGKQAKPAEQPAPSEKAQEGRMMNRHDLQREGKHPAPCARHCEATAFKIEIRRLKALLKEALPHVEDSAELGHFLDGFNRSPDNEFDKLAHRIRLELHDV